MKKPLIEVLDKEVITTAKPHLGLILITGATGYIGGRLVPLLVERGYKIRILVRGNQEEYKRRWPEVEVFTGDTLQPETLEKLMQGVNTAYYLIHSLLHGPSVFETADIQSAKNFREAAVKANIKHIIYLGGLGDTGTKLSRHLRSRSHVAEELDKSEIPVTILRAAVIIGSGSASYEMIEHLVKSLPFFIVPKWVNTRCQPISIRDVLKYLIGVLEKEDVWGRKLDIGGNDIFTYKEMLEIFARVLNKKRVFIQIPINNISIYSYIASLVTPVPENVGRCLLEGGRNDVVCIDNSIKSLIPFETIDYKTAILLALTREEQDRISTRWTDAYPPAHDLALKLDELSIPARYQYNYSLKSSKTPSELFKSICKIGGKTGWFRTNWIWSLRGMLDRLLLGTGDSRRGVNISNLRVNDVIDFWRVEDIKQNESLLLRAEMKLHGKAWLQLTIKTEGNDSYISVSAFYQPNGFFGIMYWHTFLPFQNLIFNDLIRSIEKSA
ncbi:SDR family oxidoreductase [Bacteroidota bacterium]